MGRVFPSCIEFFDALQTETAPDVVLMDLGLPGMSGIEAIRKLSQNAPDIAILVLTVFKEKKKVQDAMEAGAAGYLLKESSSQEIGNALRDIFISGAVLDSVTE